MDYMLVVLFMTAFFGGFGWGQWWVEYKAKKRERRGDHLMVSMPMDPDAAASVMRSLANLIEATKEMGDE